MKNKLVFLAVSILLCFCLCACSESTQSTSAESNSSEINSNTGDSNQTGETVQNTDSASSSSDTATQGEQKTMTVTINATPYEVELDSNKTVTDIVANMPLELSMVRYAGHEYYAELPFTPTFDENRTSEIKAGHVYYWDGWNAFVINYEDYDISPYKVVHIGEITDSEISGFLRNADKEITIQVAK